MLQIIYNKSQNRIQTKKIEDVLVVYFKILSSINLNISYLLVIYLEVIFLN